MCALFPVAFTAVVANWYGHEPPGHHFAGYLQLDLPTYLCNAREAARSPTILSYPSPWDLRDAPRALLIQWPLSLLGALLALGLTPAAAVLFLRTVGGIGMYLLLAAVLRRVTRSPGWFWSAFVFAGFGAGLAWLSAIPAGPNAAGLQRLLDAEFSYRWWFADIFRNLLYPLETLHHVVAFAWLLFAIRGRWWSATACLALAATASPFVTVTLAGAHALSAAPTWRTHRGAHAAALAVLAAFALHYALVIGRDPVLGAVAAQHRAAGFYDDPMGWVDTLRAHGLSLLALPALLLDGRFRRAVLASPLLRPFAALLVWSLALVHHPRVPFVPHVMPLHFLHGYAWLGGAALTWAWLQSVAGRGERARRVAIVAAAALPLLAAPDNVAFLVDIARTPPTRPLLLWSGDTEALLARLRALPGRLRVLTESPALSRQLCALTWHRSVHGVGMVTPRHTERMRALRRFLDAPDATGTLEGARIDAVVLPSAQGDDLPRLLATGRWRVTLRNDEWTLLLRTP